MAEVTETRITVRVQARGGKFLGDDIGGVVVTIRDAMTGELFATGTTAGDSGALSPTYATNASLSTIVTPTTPQSTVQWQIGNPTLAFNQAGTPSLFAVTFTVPPNLTADPIYYEAIVSARQLSTGNVGTGTVTFFVLPFSSTGPVAPSR